MGIAPLLLGSSIALALVHSVPAAAVTFPLNTRETFLRVDPTDVASGALIVSLADYSLLPGYTIRIRSVGEFDNGPGGETFTTLDVIFSNSGTLLGPTLQFRVPDAVDAGLAIDTAPTCPSGSPTNIPYDFFVTSAGVEVLIPAGATHLFVGTWDCFYRDNTDPDGDFAVEISLLATGVGDPPARGAPTLSPWPNPARGEATLSFSVPEACRVTLALYSIDGRRVRTLVEGPYGAGAHTAVWNGRDDSGNRVAPGLYFARMSTDRGVLERKLAFVR
jgi:hypothetical protein